VTLSVSGDGYSRHASVNKFRYLCFY